MSILLLSQNFVKAVILQTLVENIEHIFEIIILFSS